MHDPPSSGPSNVEARNAMLRALLPLLRIIALVALLIAVFLFEVRQARACNSEQTHAQCQPFNPPAVSPPTTRSWKIAITMATGTIATINAAEMIGHGNVYSP